MGKEQQQPPILKDFQILVSAIAKGQEKSCYSLDEIDGILMAIKAVGSTLAQSQERDAVLTPVGEKEAKEKK